MTSAFILVNAFSFEQKQLRLASPEADTGMRIRVWMNLEDVFPGEPAQGAGEAEQDAERSPAVGGHFRPSLQPDPAGNSGA